MQPNSAHVKKRISEKDRMSKTIQAMKDSCNPDKNFSKKIFFFKFLELYSKTRYGANPAFKNTFTNFKPAANSPM